ncbi:MAG: helix-turn-helix domain-containing protein [Actinomycetota bacterium]
MRAGDLIREARRRAGLTQRGLAERLDTTQSAIARLERGGTEPSYERVAEAVRACGMDLVPQLLRADDADWSVASTNLAVGPDARVRRHQAALRFAMAGRRALADVRG